MAAIPINTSDVLGANVTYYSIIAGGDTFVNDGKTMLLVKNSGSSCTVTITPQKMIYGLTLSSVSKACTSSTDVVIGPFDPSIFNSAAGAAVLSYSGGTATTTIAPVSM